jgi:hypothetical protein
MPTNGDILNFDLCLGDVVVGYTSKRHGSTLPQLITFSLSIITFSLSRTTVELSHVAAGEHMVPGPFHLLITVVHKTQENVVLKFDLDWPLKALKKP